MKKLLICIFAAIGVLPVATQLTQEDEDFTKVASIVEPEQSKEASTIGKWIVEDEYTQPDELEEFEWSGIEWGVSSNEENN